MFSTKRKIKRTRSRNVLQTELLESRAMFSATEMPQVDNSPIDDCGLDIPACERPYGQDNSGQGNSDKTFKERVVCWWKNVVEGKERLDSDTNDLCLGINEPEPETETAKERGKCYKDLDDKESEKEEEE